MKLKLICITLLAATALTGCKYYGSALPPEYPMSMDDAFSVARDKTTGTAGAQRQIIQRSMRPRVEQPAYIPEKEMALVAPPRTLLVWTYPHVTDDNTRVFGSWSTVFLRERYEWVKPANEVTEDDMVPSGMPPSMNTTGGMYVPVR